MREGGGPPMERRASPAWGEGRSEAGSRPPRREFVERPAAPERAPTAAEQDNQWRSKMRPDAPPAAEPEASTPTSPAAPAAPKERPRLNLAKRTVSTNEPSADASSTETSSKASPFGAARPVDTATKEKEMTEKREQAQRQKQEADTKAREEKAAKDAAARAARAERADKGQAGDETVKSPSSEAAPPTGPRRPSRQQNQNANSKSAPKENGESSQRERPSFSILRRDAEGDADEAADGDVPDADANGTILGDKETKPQEIVREVPKEGSAEQNAEPTAEAMDDDGWSTVAAKPKTGRRGGGAGGARALAS